MPGRDGWCWPRRAGFTGLTSPSVSPAWGLPRPCCWPLSVPGAPRCCGGLRGSRKYPTSRIAYAAAAAGGRVELAGCPPGLYEPVLEILEQMGCTVKRGADRAEIARFGRLYGVGRVFTGVYPGLATDAAPLLAAAMLCAEGESSIEDVIFERRFGCAEGFERLGGRVKRSGRVLSVGPLPESGLHGATLTAPDLRGGAALVVAALSAQGKSFVEETRHIDRGYAGLWEVLASLGGRIGREMPPLDAAVKKIPSKKQIYLAFGAKR